jgi:Mce-associated membrane protein
VVALAGLIRWLGYRTHESHHAKAQRELFVEVGRQAAINLTTFDFQEVDTDVRRILDSSTGALTKPSSSALIRPATPPPASR